MHKSVFILTLLNLVLLSLLSGCAQTMDEAPLARQDSTDEDNYYQAKAASFDGIGKVYMGREISHVMGHLGASWLERPNREQEELPDQVVRAMDFKADDVVADIGAGTGYFSFRVSNLVPQGTVLAVDIQDEMLDMIKAKSRRFQINNVKPIKGQIDNPNLPENSVDLAFMVDAYHEFSHPREMMQAIVTALKPNGKVVLIEYRGEDEELMIKPLHKMTVAQTQKEMQAVGLEFVENKNFLPSQHFLIFRKP